MTIGERGLEVSCFFLSPSLESFQHPELHRVRSKSPEYWEVPALVPGGGKPTRFNPLRVPDPETLSRIRRDLARRYPMQPEDLDDVISQSVLDYLRASKTAGRGTNALFLVIARRRASDFCRHRRDELPLTDVRVPSTPPDREHLESDLFERILLRFSARHPRLNSRRLLGLIREMRTGASFPGACRTECVPRGSQGRYRAALKECFRDFRDRHR